MAGLSYLQRFSFTALFTFSILVSLSALAEDGTITYKIAQAYSLTPSQSENSQWLAPQSLPRVNENAFIANKKGQFFQVTDQQLTASAFLNINAIFPKNKQLKLTAFAVHPNFSSPDNTGEGVLYTAHVEYVLGESAVFLSDQATPKDLAINYHAVVNEWQLSLDTKDHYQHNNQPREILRIALTDAHQGITQLGFNPYLKAWNEDFGLLHLVLPSDNGFANIPLYSGSVLRINPARFALKHYTVPSNNPFLKKHKILNEAIVIGASDIQSINWTKHDEKKIIISHITANNAQVSYANVGTDWLAKDPTKTLWQQEGYQAGFSSRVFTLNKLEFLSVLHQEKESWQISTLNLSQLNESAATQVWEVAQQFAKADDKLLMNNRLLYNANTKKVMSLSPIEKLATPVEEQQVENRIEYAAILYFAVIIAIVLIMGWLTYFTYRHYNGINVKPILRQNFSLFECTKNSISLYSRGQAAPAEILNINSIICCEISLNDAPILRLNPHNLFDDELKNVLLQAFNLEQQHKMTGNKIRKIMLVLTGENTKTYSICLYLRKGDQRYTKTNYQLTQTKLIDWAQLYSSTWAP